MLILKKILFRLYIYLHFKGIQPLGMRVTSVLKLNSLLNPSLLYADTIGPSNLIRIPMLNLIKNIFLKGDIYN